MAEQGHGCDELDNSLDGPMCVVYTTHLSKYLCTRHCHCLPLLWHPAHVPELNLDFLGTGCSDVPTGTGLLQRVVACSYLRHTSPSLHSSPQSPNQCYPTTHRDRLSCPPSPHPDHASSNAPTYSHPGISPLLLSFRGRWCSPLCQNKDQ